eukprot:TRINITY_DN15868_c0_g1_i1.p1 TRINITY_DN15868_c0_g1~~TRINITY_DN15868_c0_g1_i1.p1  ORF type:complete len:408 (+),score=77.13 TRINITY_DN15868_c0_g1_i1:92-1315(+)
MEEPPRGMLRSEELPFRDPVPLRNKFIQGHLWKRGQFGLLSSMTWQKLWFVKNAHSLSYYKSKQEALALSEPAGNIDLTQCIDARLPADNFGYPRSGENWGLELVCKERSYILMAPTQDEQQAWLQALSSGRDALDTLAQPAGSDASASRADGYSLLTMSSDEAVWVQSSGEHAAVDEFQEWAAVGWLDRHPEWKELLHSVGGVDLADPAVVRTLLLAAHRFVGGRAVTETELELELSSVCIGQAEPPADGVYFGTLNIIEDYARTPPLSAASSLTLADAADAARQASTDDCSEVDASFPRGPLTGLPPKRPRRGSNHVPYRLHGPSQPSFVSKVSSALEDASRLEQASSSAGVASQPSVSVDHSGPVLPTSSVSLDADKKKIYVTPSEVDQLRLHLQSIFRPPSKT